MLRVQVQADSSGQWAGNALEFNTVDEAVAYARDLASRWLLVREWRVINGTGEEVPVNDCLHCGRWHNATLECPDCGSA